MIRLQRYKYTNFPTTGYAQALKFMLIRRELRGTGTGCLFQFTYCVHVRYDVDENILQNSVVLAKKNNLVFSSDFEINSGHYIHEERIKQHKKKSV